MNKILELLAKYWEAFKVFQIIDPYEGGVHLRSGHYLRTMAEGLWWKLPIVDSFMATETVPTTLSLPTQTIGEKIVSAIIRYKISDPKPYLLDLWDAEDVLQDVCMGAIRLAVEENPSLPAVEIEGIVLPLARKALQGYGIKIYNVTFVDFGKIKSLRIIMDSMESG